MRIKSVPNKVIVACSGGPDSMALLEYCRLGKKDVAALHIHHGTNASSEGLVLVQEYCDKHNILLFSRGTGARELGKLPRVSDEQFWSEKRASIYRAFQSADNERIVITGHTLDDAMEWWLLSAFRGNPLLLPWQGLHTYRPALLVDRCELRHFAETRGVPFIDDPTNVGHANDRAKLRTLPLEALFPQIRGTIRNKLLVA
jgi:tRNA(Ile)-lysidine synthase